jgi:transposase
MEACSGSHYWAKVFADLGHEVRLISPQFVDPLRQIQQNDRNDAEAICEAIGRPSMRFVAGQVCGQLEIQAVHAYPPKIGCGPNPGW